MLIIIKTTLTTGACGVTICKCSSDICQVIHVYFNLTKTEEKK